MEKGGGGDGQPSTSETPFITWTGSLGRTGLMALLFCPDVYLLSPSLCSGTLMSMGMATSHRKSSRSSVGTFLTSAPLGTSTRTSEEGWGRGEREGRLTSPWVSVPSCARSGHWTKGPQLRKPPMWGGALILWGEAAGWHRVTSLTQTDGSSIYILQGLWPGDCCYTNAILFVDSQLARSVSKLNSWVACFNE